MQRKASPGATVPVTVRVSPGASGPVRIVAQRLDPLFGWLYLQTWRAPSPAAGERRASRPPYVGRFRFRAEFLGTAARRRAGADSRR